VFHQHTHLRTANLEDTLKTVCADTLGLSEYDVKVFSNFLMIIAFSDIQKLLSAY
jgi:hypothetical protein